MITAQPDITVTDLQMNDTFFILGCDGIWDCLTCQEAVRMFLQANYSPTTFLFFPLNSRTLTLILTPLYPFPLTHEPYP